MSTNLSPKTDPTLSSDSAHSLAIEEPLEIRLEYWDQGNPWKKSVSITMRTPGSDVELATGFLFTEGIINKWDDIKQVRPCGPMVDGQEFQNIVRIEVLPTVTVKTDSMERNFYTTSSCGICGKTSLEALKVHNCYGNNIQNLTTPTISQDVLLSLSERMTTHQSLFQKTGGSHASALFDDQGRLLCLREDVGRHNALDKVIGWALNQGYLPLHNHILLVSGRASFELMQKASMAGIPLLASVGAPSSLALQVAQDLKMTLVGFLNSRRFTIYYDQGRIQDQKNSKSGNSNGRKTRPNGRAVKAVVGNSPRRSTRAKG